MAAAADAPSTPRSARPIRRRDPEPTLPAPTSPMAPELDPPQLDPPAEAVNARGKRPVWSLNPSPIVPAEVGTVMGASAWPALSEAMKSSPKSCSSALPPGSAALTASMGSCFVKSNVPTNPNLATAPVPARQKSMKRVAGGTSGLPARPLLDSVQVPEIMQDRSRAPSNSNVNLDHGGRGSGFQTQLHGSSDPNRGSGGSGNRRGHNGHGGFHHNRRDVERGGYEWNNRSFVGRDVHMRPPPPPPLPVRGVRPFMPAPLPIARPFIAPAPVQLRPFFAPIAPVVGYPDIVPPNYYVPAPPPAEVIRGGPYVTHPPPPPAPMFFPVLDPHKVALLRQIEYYFSNENLIKDEYLRKRMNSQGWTHVSVIADFRRVKDLTRNITEKLEYIIETLRFSNVVEVQGYMLRRRGDWDKWLIPKEESAPAAPSFAEALAARLQAIGLDGVVNQPSSSASVTRSSSGTLSNQSQVVGDSGQLASTSSGDGSDRSRSETS